MKHYKENERERQQALIEKCDIFNGKIGGGRFMGKERPFVLACGESNLYAPVVKDALAYFKDSLSHKND